MPVLGLFNYRKFLFQRLKVLIARIFSGSKVFSLYKCWKCKKLYSSYFSKFCKGAKLFKLFVGFEKKKSQVLSEFKKKREPHSFAKCLQNFTDRKKISGKTLAIF